MSEVLQANIFFFITGIAVIVITVLLAIALFYAIKILKSAQRIVEKVEIGAQTIVEDIEQLRTYVVEESFLARFFSAVLRRKHVDEDDEPHERKASPKTERHDRKAKTDLKN